jgi:3-hydroxyisobutyrate dehydrogenase-like beta-hydroxyacid dehydrogenase
MEIGASMELGEKDVRLFREAAAANGVETPLAELMGKNFDAALEAGMKDDDWATGYYEVVRERYVKAILPGPLASVILVK